MIVELVAYDGGWAERFAEERALLTSSLRPWLRVEYETLKHQLAATEVEPRDYTNGKREMVRLVLARAGIEL